MQFRTIKLLLALLLALTAAAYPAPAGDRHPSGFCKHSNSILFHRYRIMGRDWTIKTEGELKAALESIAGIVFWRYGEKTDENGIVTFAVMFNYDHDKSEDLTIKLTELAGGPRIVCE